MRRLTLVVVAAIVAIVPLLAQGPPQGPAPAGRQGVPGGGPPAGPGRGPAVHSGPGRSNKGVVTVKLRLITK